jgi:hypothetical protein
MMKIAGSGSGSISQRYGSADPHQNVMEPEHCYQLYFGILELLTIGSDEFDILASDNLSLLSAIKHGLQTFCSVYIKEN